MFGWFGKGRCSPIGVDIGSRTVKLLQFSGDRSEVLEAVRWDLPHEESSDNGRRDELVVEALCRARQGRSFRGRDAVFCLGAENLFVQNIRVAPVHREELPKLVAAEASSRLPFRNEEAEVRFLEAGDVRQGELLRREVIVLAAPRTAVARLMAVAERAGLRPVAIDAEPISLLRCYGRLFRRDEDRQRALALVNIGAASTKVVVTRGNAAVFVKYLDVGGRQLDEAVAKNLRMPLAEAAALRRHNGDRRADQRDPEVARSIHESVRPVLDRLTNELSLCFRYSSVTFRGQPLNQVILGGGEASQHLAEWLAGRLDLPVELGNPLRIYQGAPPGGRLAQWDVAVGLALREPQN